jgi:hypothetical protein
MQLRAESQARRGILTGEMDRTTEKMEEKFRRDVRSSLDCARDFGSGL